MAACPTQNGLNFDISLSKSVHMSYPSTQKTVRLMQQDSGPLLDLPAVLEPCWAR